MRIPVILFGEKINMFLELINENLIWFPEKGVGYYPVNSFNYDADYFNKYKGYANTEMGNELNQTRVSFVSKFYQGNLLDVGIGCGQFVSSRENTYGYDVNPEGIKWLKENNLFIDLYGNKKFDALTFWDSLEHIREPEKAIRQAKKYVFVSIPIFGDLSNLLNSKHYRKDEHFWYFTHSGLVQWFSTNGFDLVDMIDKESELGRDCIFTYAFRRRKNG